MITNGIYRFFLIWYVCGVVLLSFDLLPSWLEWANAVFLHLSSLLALIYLAKAYGVRRALLVAIFVTGASIYIESLGVKYGFLFGSYDYEKDFGAKILGVPLTIGSAWFMVVITSRILVLGIMKRMELPFIVHGIAYAVISSLFAVIMDLAIDPVAYVVKQYWVWEGDSFYYNIPLSNFSGWFLLSFFIQLVVYFFLAKSPKEENPVWERRMVFLYSAVVMMFVIVALANGLWLVVWLTMIPFVILYIVYKKETRL
ncbi:carotenoid biosynthesis protein [Priestia megaterium]|uniref:carotenoid biosynthesis protein n=1 Tax=Priestia megaterium TaxID=1404 RepID=UPI0026E248BA|nr:carotenoid biosynthesis protein [Priestia megaterium]MDO6848540.1 carotenoid biosynthesis protein [Priestia megaterium]